LPQPAPCHANARRDRPRNAGIEGREMAAAPVTTLWHLRLIAANGFPLNTMWKSVYLLLTRAVDIYEDFRTRAISGTLNTELAAGQTPAIRRNNLAGSRW
jgi:hypothetical protein